MHIWHCPQCQFFLWTFNSMRVGIFGIVDNANYPLAPQFYACRHIWHCPQCQLSSGSPFLCVSALSTQLALCILHKWHCLHNWHCVDCINGIVCTIGIECINGIFTQAKQRCPNCCSKVQQHDQYN